MGKKISATLCSTGSPSCFLHPAEAVHGDLGIHQIGDPIIFLSNSGSTPELLSLAPVLRKRKAIFFHQSQNNSVMFQGDDKREFWERVEERNRDIAKRYRKLGLSDYQAMETFRRYHF